MRMLTLLHLVCILGTGLIAGTFFAFSTFVMPALGRLAPPQAIAAMQSINITVINPLFMAVLFGTVFLGAYVGFAQFQLGHIMPAVAAAVYILGGIGVTMAFNIPLNNQLETLDPGAALSADVWRTYLSSWTVWNSIRGFASLVSCALFAWSLNS